MNMTKMFRFKTPLLFLLLGLIAPVYSYAANYCVAVNGGFGNGGTSFMGINFALPDAGKCKPWSGFTKTASTVILTTTGTGCLSSDGKALTVSVSSADPAFLGAGQLGSDYIQLCPGKEAQVARMARAQTRVSSVEPRHRRPARPNC